jgi:hypothetical protein
MGRAFSPWCWCVLEDVEEDDAGVVVVEEGKTAVATDGVVAPETARHAADGREHTPLIAMIPR